MCTSFTKTYKIVFFLTFALILMLALGGSSVLLEMNQIQAEPAESFPVYVSEVVPAELYFEDRLSQRTEETKTESIPQEKISIERKNTSPVAEACQFEPELSCPEETVVNIEEPSVSAEICPVGELDALYIGDSRTKGLADYASIENADFFAAIGMSVYNIRETRVPMQQIGKVTLDELLNYKQYDIIYVMLGVNELGYAFEKTVTQYKNLVESVMLSQPDAVVILMANIHVTAQRSKTDHYINNPAIDRFNEATAQLADNKTIFFLDANSLFDDADGNLAKEKSADSAHLKAKYYDQWADWLEVETAKLLLQAGGRND